MQLLFCVFTENTKEKGKRNVIGTRHCNSVMLLRASGSYSGTRCLRFLIWSSSCFIKSLEALRQCQVPKKHWIPALLSVAPFCAGGSEAEITSFCRKWSSFLRKADPQSGDLSQVDPFLSFSITQGQNLLTGLPASLFCSNPSLLSTSQESGQSLHFPKCTSFPLNIYKFSLGASQRPLQCSGPIYSGLAYSQSSSTLRSLLWPGSAHS